MKVVPRITATLLALAALTLPLAAHADCVILLHGLSRSPYAMQPLEKALTAANYKVANIGYPSRHKPVEELAPLAVGEGVSQCGEETPIHFVTHSMGGILVRYYMEHEGLEAVGRVVMLAPPNQGSELVDELRDVPGFNVIYGPAGRQLGTGEDSILRKLGPVNFELGVIAGTKSIYPLLSARLPSPDDGTVSVQSTIVDGINDILLVDHSHSFIMRSDTVIEQTLIFLENGAFDLSRDVEEQG